MLVSPKDFEKLKQERPVSDEVVMRYVNILNDAIIENASITYEKWAEVIVDNSFTALPYMLCVSIATKFIEVGWYSVYCTLSHSDKDNIVRWVFIPDSYQDENWRVEKIDKGTYGYYTQVGYKEEIN